MKNFEKTRSKKYIFQKFIQRCHLEIDHFKLWSQTRLQKNSLNDLINLIVEFFWFCLTTPWRRLSRSKQRARKRVSINQAASPQRFKVSRRSVNQWEARVSALVRRVCFELAAFFFFLMKRFLAIDEDISSRERFCIWSRVKRVVYSTFAIPNGATR